MNKLLKSAWLIPLVGTVLYLATTLVLLNPGKLTIPKLKAAAAEHVEEQENPLKSTPWDFNVPELEKMIVELREEKARLATRQNELNELAARIAAERSELTTVTQEVNRLQREFNQVVTYVSQQEAGNHKRMARTYAAMIPEDAARILEAMDDDRIVRLLMFMSEEETAKILSVLAKPGPANARRAALLTERLRLSVQAPPAGKSQSAAPKPGSTALPPAEQLAAVNGMAQPSRAGEMRKLARSYAALPTREAVNILKQLQDEQMAAILAEFTEEETAPFLVELAKPAQAGPQRAARVHGLLLQKLNSGSS